LYNSSCWNTESEGQLLHQVHDLIALIRPEGRKLEIFINVEVENFAQVITAISKKLRKECILNNQKLSLREIEILGLIMQGFTNKKIAELLFICFETVKSHRKNILKKTGAPNTAALINYYHQTFFEK
jgi:DNA-binding NarL/FixJ family response regulator